MRMRCGNVVPQREVVITYTLEIVRADLLRREKQTCDGVRVKPPTKVNNDVTDNFG